MAEPYAQLPLSWARELSLREIRVVTVLLAYSSGGFAWPSISNLIQDSGLQRSAVFDALAKLETRGLIAREVRDGQQGYFVFNDVILASTKHGLSSPQIVDSTVHKSWTPQSTNRGLPIKVIQDHDKTNDKSVSEGSEVGRLSNVRVASHEDKPKAAPRDGQSKQDEIGQAAFYLAGIFEQLTRRKVFLDTEKAIVQWRKFAQRHGRDEGVAVIKAAIRDKDKLLSFGTWEFMPLNVDMLLYYGSKCYNNATPETDPVRAEVIRRALSND